MIFTVAIDGPAGAGKSSVARALARGEPERASAAQAFAFLPSWK